MDAAGVQAQQYDSEVNDRDQVFVDCMDTHANTEQRHGRPSDTDETDPCRSADHHSMYDITTNLGLHFFVTYLNCCSLLFNLTV